MIYMFGKSKIQNGQAGFSFISVLISLVIVGILASMALVHYRSLGVFSTDGTNPESFVRRLDKNLAIESLKKLHTMEITYHIRYNRYGTFNELQSEGYIAAGYTAKLGEHGVPFLDYWDIEIHAMEESYLLLAEPNRNAIGFDDVPILGMNESGRVWEEEGFEEFEDEPEDNTDDEIPFPFGLPEEGD
jgi:hypothetical protein